MRPASEQDFPPRALAIMLIALALAACSAPLEFDDWTIPVPEGARVIEYAHVPIEERTERIEFVEDLVLGADESDPNQAFYQPTDVAIDSDGRLFVVDTGNHRVQVFEADGSFVASLGREGQGPGEFALPTTAMVVGDRLLVSDRENARISVWSTDGEHLGDVALDAGMRDVSFIAGVESGYTVIWYSPVSFLGQSFALASLGLDGRLIEQYIELPLDRTPTFQRGRAQSFGFGNPRVVPVFAADGSGDVYITPGDQYQVLALAADGSARWALRVDWSRPPLSDGLRQAVLERVRAVTPDVSESEINYIDRAPGVSWMSVDGRGRLYVYPYVEPAPGEYPYPEPASGPVSIADVPVDVYSSDGEHLFSGMIPGRRWRRAEGDYVYGVGINRESGEFRAVRWTLDAPFDGE